MIPPFKKNEFRFARDCNLASRKRRNHFIVWIKT